MVPQNFQPHGQLRIALAMSGGIALTLYEAGVSHEVHRLLRAWQELTGEVDKAGDEFSSTGEGYREALTKTKLEPVIDILTGASAGGINSIFLASCIASGRDFSTFHDIWIDTADVGTLKYKRFTSATSILDTQLLDAAMTKELETNAALAKAALDAKRPVPELRVQLCRTEHKGRCLSSIDAIGHKIDVETRANIIKFETSHFQGAEHIKELVAAALATSAFPAIFPPVEDEKLKRWFVDGGLWDNQPIDLAVAALRDKPAVSRTHRCVFFVEPNPSFSPENSTPETAPPQPSASEILGGLPFLGLKGNIWPAIESILDFNQRHALYQALGDDKEIGCYLQKIGHLQYHKAQQQLEASEDWRKKHPTQNNGNSWEFAPLNLARFTELLLGNNGALGQMWRQTLETANRTHPEAAPLLRAWALATLWLFGQRDLARLYVRKQLQDSNQALATATAAPTEEHSARKSALYQKLDQLNQVLNAKSQEKTFAEQTEAWLKELHSEFGENKNNAAFPMEKLQRACFAWHETIKKMLPPSPVHGADRRQFTQLLKQCYPNTEAKKLDELLEQQAKQLEVEITDFFKELGQKSALDAHEMITDFLLGGVSDLVGKGAIDLVRISPNDTANETLIHPVIEGQKGTPAQRKLAGEGLGHLTGFLESRWRRNDYIWGRLDAAEILLRAVQRAGEKQNCLLSEADYQHCLAQAQDAILQEEAQHLDARLEPAEKAKNPNWHQQCGSLGRKDAAGNSLDKATQAANRKLIGLGLENLQDASEPALSQNVDYLVGATIRLARGSSREMGQDLTIIERLSRLFSHLMLLMTWVAPVSVHRRRTGTMIKWAICTLLIASIASIMAFLIASGSAISAAMANVVMGGVIGLTLLCIGAVLGWKWWWAGVALFLAGLGFGWMVFG